LVYFTKNDNTIIHQWIHSKIYILYLNFEQHELQKLLRYTGENLQKFVQCLTRKTT